MMQHIWLARSRPMRHLLVAWCVCYGAAGVGWLGAALGAGGVLGGFFRPLPFAVIEHLATELQSATYEPGDVVIREGEPGNRFYMIVEGRARASQDGRLLNELAAPGSFGDIALLRRIPRVVTITATSRLEARILAREEFLAAVTGNPESVDSADEVISTWLGSG